MHFSWGIIWKKLHQNRTKNKIFSILKEIDCPLPPLLWPLLARKQYEIEKICWHSTENSHWEESNAKDLIKIGWKIKISHLLQNRIFKTLRPLLYKKRYILQKNAWSNFYSIFYEESFAKKPIKIRLKITFFHINSKLNSPSPH